jgi:hypothetical protein
METPLAWWQSIQTGEEHPPFYLPSNTDDSCSTDVDYFSTDWPHKKTADRWNDNCYNSGFLCELFPNAVTYDSNLRKNGVEYHDITLTTIMHPITCWVLPVRYSIRDHCGFGLCPSYGILKNRTFSKLDLFPFSGERVEETNCVTSVRKD